MISKRKSNPLPAKLIDWWHPTLNGDLRPEDVRAWSHKAAWFLHYDSKWKQWHEWDIAVSTISKSENCAICTGHRLVVGINDLATRNPIVASKWHPTLNGELNAQMVTEHSRNEIWWQHYHKKTGVWHEWPMSVDQLTKKKPNECSICSGHRIQVGVNDLATTHSVLASEWHPTLNGALTAQMVSRGSQIEIWWQRNCFNNGISHEWHAMPSSRTDKKPQSCAICEGRQVQRGVNDLASQYPNLMREWDKVKNKSIKPNSLTKGSDQIVWWKHYHRLTKKWHSWSAAVSRRTGTNPRGCLECSKTGFDTAKPAHLYVLSGTLSKTPIIQFGISNDVKTRLVKHVRSGFTNPPVTLISFSKGADARSLEVSLLDLLKDYHVPTATQRNIKFDGSTEAFCLEDADEEFLIEFRELVGL